MQGDQIKVSENGLWKAVSSLYFKCVKNMKKLLVQIEKEKSLCWLVCVMIELLEKKFEKLHHKNVSSLREIEEITSQRLTYVD